MKLPLALLALVLLAPCLAAQADESARFEEAARLYQRLVERKPGDKDVWWDLIYGYSDRKMYREAAVWLEKYIRRFPGDAKGYEELVSAYQSAEDPDAAIRVLRAYLQTRPDDGGQAKRLADLLLYRERYEEAEALASSRLASDPDNADWLLILAHVYAYSGRPQRALEHYERLLAQRGDDPEVLREVGMQSLFASEHVRARKALRKALRLRPEDREAAAYLAETEFALGHGAAGRRLAKRVLRSILDDERPATERLRLRLAWHLGWSDEVEGRYRALAERRPKDAEVLTDWIDGLLYNRLPARAQLPLSKLEALVGSRRKLHLYRYEVLSRLRDWKGAEKALLFLLETRPGDAEARRLLAELYAGTWRWEDARRLLPGAESEDCRDRELAEEVRGRVGPRYGTSFRLYNLPDETSVQTGLGYGRSRGALRWDALARHGVYRVKSRDFTRSIGELEGRAVYEGRYPYRFGAVAGVSAGALENTFSPGLSAEYGPRGGPRIGARYRYRRLFSETAFPLASGGLADDLSLSAQARVWGRVYLEGEYLYNHYRTKSGGGQADRHQLTPQAGFVLTEGRGPCGGPALTAGYRYSLDRAAGDDSFFERVPLVRDSSAHCLNVSYAQKWLMGRYGAESSAYGCADAVRNLGFGELFGVSGRFLWEPLPWLRAAAGYEYGRETALGETGQSHTVTVRLEAIWHDGKEEDPADRR